MRRILEAWRALAAAERWLLVRLAILLPVIGGALRLFGFAGTCRLLAGAGSAVAGCTGGGADAEAKSRRLGWLVNVASRYGVYRATCLRQSLALWWLLRRRGFPAELRIGVGKRAQRLQAHAWVELRGRVVNDHPAIADSYAVYQYLNDRLPDSFRAS